jgi:hypothetical protein
MGERPSVVGQRHVLTEPEPGETLGTRDLSEISDITFGMFASVGVCMVVSRYHRHTIDKEVHLLKTLCHAGARMIYSFRWDSQRITRQTSSLNEKRNLMRYTLSLFSDH